ncbi:hypothetical protein [Propionivibrio sp.]|uniref:hypothetical protein n=1 Tax=Propionivibrio sp. TaxID=2212460 RepID=UPI003BEFF899
MKNLRHALFALLLLFAQVGALSHAVEHLRFDDADHSPDHVCALCLAAQNLGATLVSASPCIVLCTADFATPADVNVPVFSPSAVSPRARAPPAA